MLSEDQQRAFNLFMSGENVFLTGDAGTGKSYLLDYFIKTEEQNQKNILVCAPTGIAALNVGGTTIHRAFGIRTLGPIINDPKDLCPDEVYLADIIVIDEISMCRIDLFDYVAKVIHNKRIRSGRKTQLIVVGDFFQLPPVLTPEARDILKTKYPNLKSGFCFESSYWDDFGFKIAILHQVLRQDDVVFSNNLVKARWGDLSCIPYFNACVGREVDNAIHLTSRNIDAESINNSRLDDLPGDRTSFRAMKSGEVFKNECPTLDILDLKVGARVMCLVNLFPYASNGSMGTVTKIYPDDSIDVELDTGGSINIVRYSFIFYDYKVVEELVDGKMKKDLKKIERGRFRQLPVKLAYAITIHKSQGQTYDKVIISPESFADGQLYVALSRCKDYNSMSLTYPIYPYYLRASQEVKDFMWKILKEEQNIQES